MTRGMILAWNELQLEIIHKNETMQKSIHIIVAILHALYMPDSCLTCAWKYHVSKC